MYYIHHNHRIVTICSDRNTCWKTPWLTLAITTPSHFKTCSRSSPDVRKSSASFAMTSGSSTTSTGFCLGLKRAWRRKSPLTACCWRGTWTGEESCPAGTDEKSSSAQLIGWFLYSIRLVSSMLQRGWYFNLMDRNTKLEPLGMQRNMYPVHLDDLN